MRRTQPKVLHKQSGLSPARPLFLDYRPAGAKGCRKAAGPIDARRQKRPPGLHPAGCCAKLKPAVKERLFSDPRPQARRRPPLNSLLDSLKPGLNHESGGSGRGAAGGRQKSTRAEPQKPESGQDENIMTDKADSRGDSFFSPRPPAEGGGAGARTQAGAAGPAEGRPIPDSPARGFSNRFSGEGGGQSGGQSRSQDPPRGGFFPGAPFSQRRPSSRKQAGKQPAGSGRAASPAKAAENMYDIIDSNELSRLYQKNTRLLSRLSSAGRQNGVLQSEVCSLIEQKAQLGAQKDFLENRVIGLKEKVSLFSRQQRQFNEQSRRLKKEVENLKLVRSRQTGEEARQFKAQTQTASKKLIRLLRYRQKAREAHKQLKNILEKRRKKITLLEKRETVYQMQITALLKKCGEAEAAAPSRWRKREKALQDLLAKQKAGGKKQKQELKKSQSLIRKLEAACQKALRRADRLGGETASLRKAMKQAGGQSASHARGLKSQIKSLHEGRARFQSALKKSEAARAKESARLVKERDALRAALEKNSRSAHKKRAEELLSKVGGLEGQNHALRKKSRALEKAKRDLEKSLKSLDGRKNEILGEKTAIISKASAARAALQADLERARALSEKLGEENSFLSGRCKNMRTAFSQQEEGFQSVMMSFRRKHLRVCREMAALEKALKNSQRENESLRGRLQAAGENFESEKQALKAAAEKEAARRGQGLSLELSAEKERAAELESRLQEIREKSGAAALKERGAFEEEIKILKLRLQGGEAKRKEEAERQRQSLKSEYESRVNNLSLSYDRKLRHIRTEMENDLCAEKRRTELFQSMKEKQLKEMESALGAAQKNAHELRTASFALENSQKETMEKLKKEIAAGQSLRSQNQNLQSLWHDMQKKSEEREQKIRSLQSLNRSLSLSLSRQSRQDRQNIDISGPASHQPPSLAALPLEGGEGENVSLRAAAREAAGPASGGSRPAGADSEKPGESGPVSASAALADIHFE